MDPEERIRSCPPFKEWLALDKPHAGPPDTHLLCFIVAFGRDHGRQPLEDIYSLVS
jgi:hypothetical protein